MKDLCYIGILLVCLGCNSERPSKPDALIPKEEMSAILYDVYILNAAKGMNKSVLEKNGVFPQKYIYKKYGIDSLQFAMSNDYYAYDTEVYNDIVLKAKMKIEAEKNLYDSINKKEEKIKDSIKAQKLKLKDTISRIQLKALKEDTIKSVKPAKKSNVFGQDEN